MNASVITWNRFLAVIAAGAIVIGCDSTINTLGGGSDGIDSIDTTFSDTTGSSGETPTGDAGEPAESDDVELPAEETRSFFTAFQIDPTAEDTAGPKFVVAADIDQDGLLDLVSGWNQSQPIQLHLQRRDPEDNISFRTVTLAGTFPIAVIAGVEVGQINDDGFPDIVVLVKADGTIGECPPKRCAGSEDCAGASLCLDGCCDGNCDSRQISQLQGQIIVYFSPGNAGSIPDGDRWSQVLLVNPLVVDVATGSQWRNQFPGAEVKSFEESKTMPEWSGFTSLVVADIDGRSGDDIVVALNRGPCDALGQDPPSNTVDLWVNPGAVLAETPTGWGAPLSIMGGIGPHVKDIVAMDVDSDGDLDVIATFPDAITRNIRWARNPVNATGSVAGAWEERPIGQVDSNADVITVGDVDGDGFDDILARSTPGQIVQWFRRPNSLTVEPEFPPNDPVPDRFNFPWPVFTLTEFNGQVPEAIAIGELTGDAQNEILVAVEGGVFWYDGTVGDSVFDPWFPNTIIQDAPTNTGAEATTAGGESAPGEGVGVTGVDTATVINTLLIVDLDGDGRNDIVGTLDRRSGSGLSDDRLVWYRNVRTEDE